MTILSIVLQSLLVLYYAFSGGAKIAGAKYWVDIFKSLELPQWFRVVTGSVQLVGAAALIIGYWYEGTVAWAGIWLGITMLLACIAHFRVKDPISKTTPAIFFTALIIVLTIINAHGLRLPLF
ncbi:DoxX family protein [Paenibacillus harenae]|uniref:Membrane protein YphA (DoxX/SURF4 family) n=1 Tax=Paenibacillus harenae TaxID=306543 RepID=A0ABT9U360_PAEHA|nr:DoxX family protein [Paenibacillus harenae]MDQ0113988.1 putative membrane protein YphA (DoxX/SURF4 family) [Paenibacillus harenae]